MNAPKSRDRVDELLFLLDGLTRSHEELLAVVRDKVAQMRQASIEGLQQCLRSEEALVARIAEQEGLRKQLMDSIGRTYGTAAHRARAWTRTELAERLVEPQRSQFLEATRRLRGLVADLARANRLAGVVAQQVLKHFRHVFSAMSGSLSGQPTGYSASGNPLAGRNQTLFEALV